MTASGDHCFHSTLSPFIHGQLKGQFKPVEKLSNTENNIFLP